MNQNDTDMKTNDRPMTDSERTVLARIYNEYHSQVFQHVLRVVKNQHDSEDVVIDVFDKIRKLNAKDSTRFNEDKSSLGTWVHTVTNSVILDFFRTNHQDRYKAVGDYQDDEGNETFNFIAPDQSRADAEILKTELEQKLDKAFYELKPEYRRVASMFFIQELSYIEIADILDIPMGSVKGMLSRARAKLQEGLNGVYTSKSVNVQKAEA